jgi:hypothetical protein
MTPEEIISKFRARNYVPMPNIPGNRIFVTDCTASTLVWAEANVIIEHYMLFPNAVVPLHSHPFINRLIYMSGDYTGYYLDPVTGSKFEKTFTARDRHRISREEPIGQLHGSKTGARGAHVYNIQIWPSTVTDPLSATLAYLGPSIGPLHDQERARQ